MNTSRETIYAALFARLQTLVSAEVVLPAGYVRTASRFLKHWDQVAPEQMPYLAQVQRNETPKQQRGLPCAWTLYVDLYLYVRTNAQQDQSIVPTTLLNPIVDRIENNVLAPDSGPSENVCTLGGLVSHCWIDGTIETSEGWLGDLEVAIIPVGILVPN